MQNVWRFIRVFSVADAIPSTRSCGSCIAESCVKTFKRDYVYVHDRPDAPSVLAQLPRWFEDYNDHHPHKALRMKSPREFIRSFHQPAANCAV